MSSEARHRVAAPQVIHQTIDGEVILIHLERGTYHSLRGCGPLFFDALLHGASPGELADAFSLESEGDRAAIEATVARLIRELSDLGLLVPAPDAGPPAARAPAPVKRAFAEVKLETYTDLQDLLTADPIHDVEPPGWPAVAPEGQTRR